MGNEYNPYYIRIRTTLGIALQAIREELVAALGPGAPAYRTVAKWVERFREGRKDVNDDVISNNPHSTYDNIVAETFLCHCIVERIIRDHLKLRKVTSRWVPHQLTAEQKEE
ncbi:unnamed protein product [Adineta ricciae]|uniref:Mos1 transposase HTH domain-containing protein n=1 Tax=Adineta ricciae TaxID=249248 RepID=A0A816DDU5_ADIRI|nr:unnamed protein product [Adineta ricciae]CAF1636020.1 unnamed protein product [Adineta ricciae]